MSFEWSGTRPLSWLLIGLAALTLMTAPAPAAEEDGDLAASKQTEAKKNEAAGDETKKGARTEKEVPKAVTREFSGTFNGERLSYGVTAGETFLKNESGEDTASIFSVSYVKRAVGDPATRPVTFVFNGGPGSASLWLHLGVLGPKHIVVPSDATSAGAPPYRLEDNSLSILDVTDLVFIDPVGTGYSHALGKTKPESFWGLKEDARSIASFITAWLTKNGRWNSPRYVAGESYGTTRAAQLVAELQGGYTGVFLNGVILISAVLDFHAMEFQRGNDLPFIAFLPTYAAAAWHHGKVTPKPDDLAKFLAEVRAFAQNEYSVALLKGSTLSEGERASVVTKLARYTGLSETYIRQTKLRIEAFRFMKELLRDKGLAIGRYDARYTGEDYDNAGETFDNDPSAYGVAGAFVTAINDYLGRTLKFETDRRYKILDSEPIRNWKWTDPKARTNLTNVAPYLGQAMRENKDFRLFIASGYYDLATPFFSTETVVANNGINPAQVTMTYYEAGHMMYTHRPSLEKLTTDIRTFIKSGR